MPFVCLVLSLEVALILFASRATHLLLQFVHCTGNTLLSLPSVLLGHGVLQILFQLQAQLNGRDKWDQITRQTHFSEQPKALHTFHCFCPKRRMENLVEATASFKIILQGWTGQAYFQMVTDQTSVLVTAGRCFGIKLQPVLHNPTWLLTLNVQDCQDMPAVKGNTKVCLLKHEYTCETTCSLLPLKPVKKY